MPASVPLRSTVRIDLRSGSAAGQRCYRLTSAIELPPRLVFPGDLPIEGSGDGAVTFSLPEGGVLRARAKLFYDPEQPEAGSRADLVDLEAEQLERLEAYVEQQDG